MDWEEWQSRRCCKGDNETTSMRQFCKRVPALVLRILTFKADQLYANLHTCPPERWVTCSATIL